MEIKEKIDNKFDVAYNDFETLKNEHQVKIVTLILRR